MQVRQDSQLLSSSPSSSSSETGSVTAFLGAFYRHHDCASSVTLLHSALWEVAPRTLHIGSSVKAGHFGGGDGCKPYLCPAQRAAQDGAVPVTFCQLLGLRHHRFNTHSLSSSEMQSLCQYLVPRSPRRTFLGGPSWPAPTRNGLVSPPLSSPPARDIA